MYVLRDPHLHFRRAKELAERVKFLELRAKEVAITNPAAAGVLLLSASTDRSAAIFHVAQGLEAMALLSEIKNQTDSI